MTSSQFSGILDRLTKFTSQNLKKLIAHMNLDSFFANVDKVAVRLLFSFNWCSASYMIVYFFSTNHY